MPPAWAEGVGDGEQFPGLVAAVRDASWHQGVSPHERSPLVRFESRERFRRGEPVETRTDRKQAGGTGRWGVGAAPPHGHGCGSFRSAEMFGGQTGPVFVRHGECAKCR